MSFVLEGGCFGGIKGVSALGIAQSLSRDLFMSQLGKGEGGVMMSVGIVLCCSTCWAIALMNANLGFGVVIEHEQQRSLCI